MLQLRALHPRIDRLGLRALQLRLGLHQIDLRRDARVVSILREIERLLERRDGVLEQLPLRVQDAQLEIVGSDLRLRREARRREIRGACLCACFTRFDGAAQAPPQIRLPSGIEACRTVGDNAAGGRAADHPRRRAAANDRNAGIEGWKVRRPRGRNQGLRAAELRIRDQHVLVRYFDLLEEHVELRIAEDPPPFAAVEIVLRLRRLPLPRLLVGRGDLDLGPLVVGPDCATRERAEEHQAGDRARLHRASSAVPRVRPAQVRRHHSRKRSRYRYTTGVV